MTALPMVPVPTDVSAAATQTQQATNNAAVGQPAQQSLVEYLAATNPSALGSGAGPNELGRDVMKNLQGFFDRSQSMTSRARALTDPTPPPHASMTVAHRGPAAQPLTPDAVQVGPQPAKGSVDGQQMDRVIESLSLMFNYSIETQLVVRGATQVSGAANTLLRGQ